MARYQVTVGNVGQVYSGDSENDALADFSVYCRQSLAGFGRPAGESVVLWIDDEPAKQFEPARMTPAVRALAESVAAFVFIVPRPEPDSLTALHRTAMSEALSALVASLDGPLWVES